MGSKRDQRAQKKREKSRKKRDEARKSRGSRQGPTAPTRSGGLSIDEASAWPVGECYLSDNWHEHGPAVAAVVTRVHSDGRVALAFYEADLGEAGVTEASFVGPLTDAMVLGEVARRSEALDLGMRLDEPERVAKVLSTARALGGEAHDPVLAFLDGIDAEACEDAILTGEPPPPAPKRRSLLSRLFGG